MSDKNTLIFECRANIISKDIEDDINEDELKESFKLALVNGIINNFDNLPCSIEVGSTINEDAKIENNYNFKVVFLNPHIYDALLENQDKLLYLLNRKSRKDDKEEEDSWINNKKVR